MKLKNTIILAFLLFALTATSLAQAKKRIDYIETTTIELGTKATTTTSIEEQKPVLHKTVITLNDVSVSVSDANVGGGTLIYTFPEGRIWIMGSIAVSVTPTTTSTLASTLNASSTLSVGVGTVQTTTQASGTLATTQQDLVAAFAATSSATINVAGTAGNGILAASAFFDGTSTAKTAYLNVGVPTATDIDGNATVTFTGTVTIYWAKLGDY